MQVTVSLWYVIGCEECAAEVGRITNAAVRDIQVTKLNLSPGHKHNHDGDVPEHTAAELEAAGQMLIPGVQAAHEATTLHYGAEPIGV